VVGVRAGRYKSFDRERNASEVSIDVLPHIDREKDIFGVGILF